MKIAVITMHAVKNYGSVLQTYATQKILQSLGHEVEIINYIREKNLNSKLLATWTQNDRGLKKIFKLVILMPTVKKWKSVFGSYLDNNIALSKNSYTSEKQLLENPIVADMFCTGSDQVWNSGWNNGIEKAFYLSFVPDTTPKFSFASSIGKTELSDDEIKKVYPLLKRYNYISVREKSALKLIKGMGLNNADFCLDPTLLLTKDDWLEHAIKTSIKKKYVLIYQLNHDEKFDKYAVEFAKRKKLELYRVCTRYDQIRLSGKPIVLPEVQKLISLINNAEYVLTNSFHATAFCINLNKQFVSIYPNEYSSRISDILKLLSLENRHLSNYEEYDIADKAIDFSPVNKVLSDYRKSSIDLLKKMIEVSVENMD